jgi:arylsulfatase A-like enzyme
LARRGVLFENAFCPMPACAPSRFALITGVTPESNAPANQMRAVARRPPWMRTCPEVLRGLGYYCTNNAKTDYNCDIDPTAVWDESSYQAHWRNRPDDRPFLAVFNIDGTHESSVFGRHPLVVDPADVRLPPYLPDTAEIREDLAQHYGRIAEMDAAVGSLLAQLEDDGLLESTIVIHTSDHGGVIPRSKRYCYDEGLHVPLIIAAPDAFASRFPPAGSRVTAAVNTLRIPPTLIDLAGGTVPDYMQGRSLVQREFDADRELAFGARDRMDSRYDVVRTVRDSRYRYIRNYHPHRPHGQHIAYAWLASGYQSWEREHLAGRLDATQSTFWQPKPGIELYDTAVDPDELHNLAGHPRHRAVENRLSSALRAHLLEIWDNGFLPEGAAAEGYDASRAPGAYPVEEVLDVADAVTRQDPAEVPRFLGALDSPDATVRRWGAIGLLALGEASRSAAGRLHVVLDAEDDRHVVIPVAEWLARYDRDTPAVALLAGLAAPGNCVPLRLEALNALTALSPDLVREHRDVLALCAEDANVYIHNAGLRLLHEVDGTYTPETRIFP